MGSLRSLSSAANQRKWIVLVYESRSIGERFREEVQKMRYSCTWCSTYTELEGILTDKFRKKEPFPHLIVVSDFFAHPMLGVIGAHEGAAIIGETKRLCRHYNRPEVPCIVTENLYNTLLDISSICSSL